MKAKTDRTTGNPRQRHKYRWSRAAVINCFVLLVNLKRSQSDSSLLFPIKAWAIISEIINFTTVQDKRAV